MSKNIKIILLLSIFHNLFTVFTARICAENDDGSSPSGHSVDAECFTEARDYLLHPDSVLSAAYYPQYLKSSWHFRRQIDLLTGKCQNQAPTLADLLYHEESLFHLTEFLETEGAGQILQFAIAAAATAAAGHNGRILQEDAMAIYDKYFSWQVTCDYVT